VHRGSNIDQLKIRACIVSSYAFAVLFGACDRGTGLNWLRVSNYPCQECPLLPIARTQDSSVAIQSAVSQIRQTQQAEPVAAIGSLWEACRILSHG
jgi:hypothetical protein